MRKNDSTAAATAVSSVGTAFSSLGSAICVLILSALTDDTLCAQFTDILNGVASLGEHLVSVLATPCPRLAA